MSELPETPQSREEEWLALIAGMEGIEPSAPISRVEKWLAYIAENGGGGGEPSEYIKSVSVSGNTLTITKKDDTTVTFTPSFASEEYVNQQIGAAIADVDELLGSGVIE